MAKSPELVDALAERLQEHGISATPSEIWWSICITRRCAQVCEACLHSGSTCSTLDAPRSPLVWGRVRVNIELARTA
jgi:hypothetical protein